MANRKAYPGRFRSQIQRLQNRLIVLERLSYRYSSYRLIAFFTGAGLGAGSLYWRDGGVTTVVIAIALFFFVATVRIHQRVERTIAQFNILRRIKEDHLARMQLDWDRIQPPSAPQRVDPTHPYGNDLDIVGERSLHRLIDTTVTIGGSQRLKERLLEVSPNFDRTIRNQRLVKELTQMVHFRERLRLNFEIAAQGSFDSDKLLDWTRRQPMIAYLRPLIIAMGIWSTANLCLSVSYFFGLNLIWLYLSLGGYFLVYFVSLLKLGDFFGEILFLQSGLKKMSAALLYLETYSYRERRNVKELCAPFTDPDCSPSVHLNRLKKMVLAIGLRMNPVLQLALNCFFPWDFYFVDQLQRCKTELARQLPVWLETWYELETANSLANFAYLNPGYSFPKITVALMENEENGEKGQEIFCASEMGHPLIHPDQRITNDFVFGNRGDIALITGSNMAGKSSFLRTIGVNLCLAYAGGAVHAAELSAPIFRIYACIRVNDSVTEGFSYFYAEVRRLRTLLSELQRKDDFPLLFLIDEIFKGTNNRERLIGSQSYIKALSELRNGLGMITTHDLELVKLDRDVPQLKNYHFREDVIDGKMVFDYKLRSGPCPTTNALKIMLSQGLPVDISEL
ncbi:MAG: hypothetical protein B6244_06445 [Candidatus Cloacimonetes bacterium 4572_55]|nr:MAG: hypothetical protein B6244_06445 [Candidatus Cloacimonetes bacterium 4572_55]